MPFRKPARGDNSVIAAGLVRHSDDCTTTSTRSAALAVNEPTCPEDLNGDGVIDLADLGILLADFGREP